MYRNQREFLLPLNTSQKTIQLLKCWNLPATSPSVLAPWEVNFSKVQTLHDGIKHKRPASVKVRFFSSGLLIILKSPPPTREEIHARKYERVPPKKPVYTLLLPPHRQPLKIKESHPIYFKVEFWYINPQIQHPVLRILLPWNPPKYCQIGLVVVTHTTLSCLGSRTSGVEDTPFLGSVCGTKEVEEHLLPGGFVYARDLRASTHHRDTRSLPRFRPPGG